MMDFDAERIELHRLCLTHDPQPGLGQYNWPMVLGAALDEIERLRLQVIMANKAGLNQITDLRAALDRVMALCVRWENYGGLSDRAKATELRAAVAGPQNGETR